MKKRSEDHDVLREKIIGLGEKSVRKTFYPALQTNIEQLKRFKALLSKVQDAIIIIDPLSHQIEDVNQTGITLFKSTPEEIIGRSFYDLLDEESGIKVKAFFEDENSRSLSLVAEINKSFSEAETFVEINLDMEEVKGTVYSVAVMRDCTERVKIRHELLSNESNLAAIIENTNDLIWSVDQKLNLLKFNTRYSDYIYNLYNVSANKGMCVLCLMKPDEQLQWGERYNKALAGDVSSYEINFVFPEGMRIYEVSFNPIKLGVTVTGVSVFARDISKRKMTEQTLEQHKAAMEASIDGMALLGSDEHFIYMNKAHANLFGYEKEELTGASWEELYTLEGAEQFRREILPVLKKNGSWRGETVNKRKNGELFTQELSLNLFKEGVYVCVSRDIQERIDIQEKTKAAKELAEKSDRLKTEFLAQISHEIRTPINAMLSFSSLIKQQLSGVQDDIIDTGFNIIENAGARIIRTVDLLLNMSELYVGTYDYKAQEINIVSDIIDGLFRQFKGIAAQKGLELKLKSNVDRPVLRVDRYSVTQIFENLINNAIKYTERGTVEIIVDENERFVIVRIKDTGIGISEEYIGSLFEPFSQEEQGYTRKYEGNGLGLALVKKYCDLNNAIIRVASKKGKGSTFSLFLNK